MRYKFLEQIEEQVRTHVGAEARDSLQKYKLSFTRAASHALRDAYIRYFTE